MKRGTTGGMAGRLARYREPVPPAEDALLELFRHRADATRAHLAALARTLFDGEVEGVTDHERMLMGGLVRRLVDRIEDRLRRDLAARLEAYEGLPAAATRKIAGAEPGGVFPVLAASGLLRDIALIEAVRQRVRAHQLSIALRRRRAECDLDRAADDMMTSLLRDSEPAVTHRVMEYLAAESRRVDTFQNPVLAPEELEIAVRERLYWSVAAAVRRLVLAGFEADRLVIDDATEAVTAEALAAVRAKAGERSPAEALIDDLARSRQLTEAGMVRLLGEGEVALFEAAFTRTTALAPRLARRLLFEPDGEGLAVACKAAGLSHEAFVAIFRLLLLVRRRPARENAVEAARLGRFFDRLSLRAAGAVVRQWRRDPRYQFALARLGGDERSRGDAPADARAGGWRPSAECGG